MDTPVSVLEITSNAVKLVVGYALDNRPIILYSGTYFTGVNLTSGEDFDETNIVEGIHNLVSEAEATVEFPIEKVIFGIPAVHLAVYQDTPSIPPLNEDGKVSKVDVQNVFKRIRRNNFEDKQIVNILPVKYTLDNGRTFLTIPEGEVTSLLRIDCFLYLIPKTVYERYTKVVSDAGLSIIFTFINEYALSALLKQTAQLPQTYYVVDIGAKTTSISFINDKKLYFGDFIPVGSDDLTALISERLNVTLNDANDIKRYFGYEEKVHEFNMPLPLNNSDAKIYQNDLNAVIKDYFATLFTKITEAIKTMETSYSLSVNNVTYPLFYTGGGASINGFKALVKLFTPNFEPEVLVPTAIGARNSAYAVSLGLILSYNEYEDQIGDERSDVSSLTRENN
jgi:cell division protein FtsA